MLCQSQALTLPECDTLSAEQGWLWAESWVGRALPSSPGQVEDGGTGDLCRGVLWWASWLQLRGVFGKLIPWVESQEGKGGQGEGSSGFSCLRGIWAGALCDALGGAPWCGLASAPPSCGLHVQPSQEWILGRDASPGRSKKGPCGSTGQGSGSAGQEEGGMAVRNSCTDPA